MICLSSATRPTIVPRPGEMGCFPTKSSHSGDALPYAAARRNTFPSDLKMMPWSARHSFVAFSIRVSRTGCRSDVDRLMTFKTSLMAVCCSSASLRSRVRSSTFCSRFSVASLIAPRMASRSRARCPISSSLSVSTGTRKSPAAISAAEYWSFDNGREM